MGDNEVTLADDRLLASWNSHDTEALLDGVADDIVWQDVGLPEPLHGKEAVNEYFQGWMTAFPDFQANPVNRVVGDDSVAVEVVFTGTNTGPMNMGDQTIPATGKAITSKGVYFATVRDGKLSEMHTYPDLMGMMMQLGLAG